jgi:nucleoside-diphosphate-sugar epimerase
MSSIIMVTGGTGYVGSWIVKKLLEAGYTVRMTVRDKSRTSKYAVLQQIADQSSGSLEFWEADLLVPGSFDAAAKGSDAIMHVASPFKIKVSDPQKELIDPALEGTRNVLAAATKSGTVRKVVLTSSVAAIHGDNADMADQGLSSFNEESFNTTSSLHHSPYSYSKVLAEKEAWSIAETQSAWKLVVVNPSLVLGPPLMADSASGSFTIMQDMLRGTYRFGAPDIRFGYVDVRDVADAHLLALEKGDAHGRYLLAERTSGIIEITKIIRAAFGDKYQMPKGLVPKWSMYVVGPFTGLKWSFIRRSVGHSLELDASKSREHLGLRYTPLDVTVKDMVNSMEEFGLNG